VAGIFGFQNKFSRMIHGDQFLASHGTVTKPEKKEQKNRSANRDSMSLRPADRDGQARSSGGLAKASQRRKPGNKSLSVAGQSNENREKQEVPGFQGPFPILALSKTTICHQKELY
jgi:hypothetical protein